MQDTFYRAIIISADTDMRSAVEMARGLNGTKCIDIVAPPKRRNRAHSLKPIYEIPRGKLISCRLNDVYREGSTVIATVPVKYQKPSP